MVQNLKDQKGKVSLLSLLPNYQFLFREATTVSSFLCILLESVKKKKTPKWFSWFLCIKNLRIIDLQRKNLKFAWIKDCLNKTDFLSCPSENQIIPENNTQANHLLIAFNSHPVSVKKTSSVVFFFLFDWRLLPPLSTLCDPGWYPPLDFLIQVLNELISSWPKWGRASDCPDARE